MTNNRLQNYLRTYRRRHGFSQSEIALLLGVSSETKVSRYESFRRHPAVFTVFAFEIIFNTPARELFAGSYDLIRRDVRKRASRLIKMLEAGAKHAHTLRKLQLLRTIVESEPNAADK